jgi:glycerophosphoryl diester phosphodiesterase
LTKLPNAFLDVPIAHRALHNVAVGRPENSLSAIQAAIAGGYGIEIDVQLTSDGAAMVFHDYDLPRLTGQQGQINQLTQAQAQALPLLGGAGETVPTLPQVLAAVAGQVPLLIEIKDQDGAMGPNVGSLEQAVATAISGYVGPLAVMSFNPHSVAAMADFAPDVARGLTTCDFAKDEFDLDDAELADLRDIQDFDRVAASFISHWSSDLTRPSVQRLRDAGVPVFCWTIRSQSEEAQARKLCDNVTFEGYTP